MFARMRDLLQIHENTVVTSLIGKPRQQWNVSKRHSRDRNVWSPVRSVVVTMDYKLASALVLLHVFFNSFLQKLRLKVSSFWLMWLVSLFFTKEGDIHAMSRTGVRTTHYYFPLLGFNSLLSTSCVHVSLGRNWTPWSLHQGKNIQSRWPKVNVGSRVFSFSIVWGVFDSKT